MIHQTLRTSCFHAFEQRLEDVALVELGVADDARSCGPAAVRPASASAARSPARVAAKLRHRDAEADRAGGEVDVVGVLGARGVGLRAAEPAEALELLAASGCRTGTGWRGTPGSRAASPPPGPPASQGVEVERGHQRRHRCARRLVAADLQPVARGPEMIRVVDRPDGQPEDLPLERAEEAEIGCGALGRGRRRYRRNRHQPLGCLTVAGADKYLYPPSGAHSAGCAHRSCSSWTVACRTPNRSRRQSRTRFSARSWTAPRSTRA